MQETFTNILSSLLEDYEKNPEQDLELFLQTKFKEMGLSEDDAKLLDETNDYISAFADKAESLAKAREEGKTRGQWIAGEMERMTDGRSEEEKATLATAITEANEKVLNETADEAEQAAANPEEKREVKDVEP